MFTDEFIIKSANYNDKKKLAMDINPVPDNFIIG